MIPLLRNVRQPGAVSQPEPAHDVHLPQLHGPGPLPALVVSVLRQRSGKLPTAAYALLAWDSTRLAGFAAYSFLWPAAGLTRSLYLKELYVAGDCRHRGVGKMLMQAVFDVASKHGCSRVEWTTDRDNSGAQGFYAALGLPTQPSKVFYRVEDTRVTSQGFLVS